MKQNKAIGPNTIPTKILKEFKTELSEPLNDIINVSFNKGICPDFNVVPIYKKGEKLDFNNYRLNPLISNIIKLYEKAIHIRLTNFLRINKVLFSYQFCFQNSYSTNHALISITEMITNALDNGNFACGVFIDLQKSFPN